MSEKIAVVLFNMGGPDSLQAVRPFLRNLFADRAIINMPNPFRYLLAEMISRGREKEAQKNYAHMGGKSPIVDESEKQASAVEAYLGEHFPKAKIKCFVAMRYWAPRIDFVQDQIKNWGADKTVLMPLYPQFSTTTTGTFFTAWDKHKKLNNCIKIISYEDNNDFISAHVSKIISTYEAKGSPKNLRLIMSAHGLPEKIIEAGDPYQQQIEKTCAAIAKALPRPLQDMQIAYQSRVGPLQWIGPATLDEIKRAASDKKAVMIVPVAFVSEHVETLVELDIDYRQQAETMGVKTYIRVPTLGVEPDYVRALGELVIEKLKESAR
ncbi:MAG: ferrochelatase [Robiginitomaculum sp.]|nr:ferrochelatase [Robiginitomaculum sp.]MDQ7078906.1 ferrochelatase [Robiginitomaculum sp.]